MCYICAFGRLIVMFVMFSRLPFYLFEFRTGVNLFYMLHNLFTVSSDISIKSRSVVSMMMLWSNGYQGKKIFIVSNIKFITLILLMIQVTFPAVTICNQNRVSCKNLEVSKSYIGRVHTIFPYPPGVFEDKQLQQQTATKQQCANKVQQSGKSCRERLQPPKLWTNQEQEGGRKRSIN